MSDGADLLLAAAPARVHPSMVPDFSVALDLDRGTLEIYSQGLWEPETVDRFLAAMEDVMRRYADAGLAERSLRTMIDLRRHAIQVRDTVERVMPRVPQYHQLSMRSAVLLPHSALLKMQAERLLKVDRHRFFTTEVAARAWLATGHEDAEAA